MSATINEQIFISECLISGCKQLDADIVQSISAVVPVYTSQGSHTPSKTSTSSPQAPSFRQLDADYQISRGRDQLSAIQPSAIPIRTPSDRRAKNSDPSRFRQIEPRRTIPARSRDNFRIRSDRLRASSIRRQAHNPCRDIRRGRYPDIHAWCNGDPAMYLRAPISRFGCRGNLAIACEPDIGRTASGIHLD